MKILYVEDEIAHVELTERTLEDNLRNSFILYHADSLRAALKILETESGIDLVLTDLRLPDGSGLDLLKKVRELPSPPAVVLVTGQGDQEIAVTALKAGAADYLVKQSDYLHRLPVVINNAVAQNRLAREQAALREAQARFRTLVEQIPAAIYTDLADQNTTRIYISPQIEEISGYAPQEWLRDPKSVKNILHPEDRTRFIEEDKITNRTGEPFNLEYRIIRKDGQIRLVHDTATLVHDENGKPLYWQGIIFDITKERESQQAILASEERFRRIFHSTPIATCVVTVNDGQFIDANQAFQDLVGVTLENLVGHTSQELGFWQGNQTREDFINKLKEQGTLKELEIRYPNVPDGPKDTLGFYEIIELSGEACLLAMFYDVTEQKKTQEAIKASESSYRGLFNSITQAIYIQDQEGRFVDVNDGAVSMYGYPRKFFIGKTPEVLSAPGKNNLNEIAKKLEKAFSGEPQEFEFWGLRSNGEVFPKDVTLNKGTYFGQDVIIAIGQDITLRKKAEAVLEYQLKELSVLHSAANAGVQSSSEDEIIESITKITAQLYPEVCGILLLNQEGNLLTPHRSYMGADIRNWQQGYPITTGITGKAVSTGKSLRIGDISKESDYIEIATHIQSELCVPIRVNERAIGVLNVESQKPFAFDEEDERLLSTIAGGLGTALERLRLFNEERRRANEFTTLYATTRKLTAKWDLQGLLDTVLNQAIELLNTTGGGIYLYNAAHKDLEVAVARGIFMHPGTRLQLGEGMAGQVAISHKPIIVDDYKSWENRSAQYANFPIRAVVEVPMLYSGELIGVLAIIESDNSTRKFTKADADLLSLFAAQAASAIENVRLFESEKQRRQEAAAIAEVGRDISSTLQLDAVLERIAEYARDLLYADASAVFLADTTEPILRAIAAVGEDAKEIKNYPLELGKGILGNIALHKMGEVVNYTINDPRTILIKDTESDPDEHIMGVPILSKDQHSGLVAVWRSGSDNEFLQSDLEFLNSLAQQAATAIENARLYNEAQLRLTDLEVINQVSTALRSTKSLDEILPIFLDETLKLLQSEHGSLWLYDAVQNELVQRIARGLPIEFKTQRIKPAEGIIGHVFSSGNVHVSEEFLSDPLLFKGNLEQTPPGLGGICVPIQSTAGPVGAILIELDKSKHTTNQIGLLTTLTEIAGNAIHRAELYEQGQEQIRRLTTLRDIDSAIASSTDLRVTLNILMDHTLKHLKTDAVDIMLYHPELQSLTYLCSAGFNSPSPSRPLMRLGEGLAGQVVMKGGSEYVADLRVTNEVKRDPMLIREGFVTYFGIPLIVKGQIKGVFEIFHRTPFTPPSEWTQFLQTLAGQAAIAIDNSQLFDHLQRSNQEVTQAYDTTLEGWARALELRDRETEGHTRRVTELTMELARFMNISDEELVNIYRGVLLHDIGKMGVPDQILRKTGPLIDSEWVEMRKHPEYAFNLLAPIPYLRPALDIPYCHHEHWDGSGYPRGLKGEQIPLSARIFSIVDIWDALLSDRVYRKAWPKPKVLEYLKEISGTILDPKVVIEFFRMMDVGK